MTRQAILLLPMDVSEHDDIPFDFSYDLGFGETIASAAVSVERHEGPIDGSMAAILQGGSQIGTITNDTFAQDAAGKVVLQRFANLQEGTTYALRAVVTLSSGRVLSAVGLLPGIRLG